MLAMYFYFTGVVMFYIAYSDEDKDGWTMPVLALFWPFTFWIMLIDASQ